MAMKQTASPWNANVFNLGDISYYFSGYDSAAVNTNVAHKIGVWNAHLVAGQTGLSWDSYYGDTGALADTNKAYIAKLTFNDGVLSLDRNSETIKTINGPNKDDYGIFDGADSTKKLTLGYDGTAHSNGYYGHHSEYAEVLVFDRALTSDEEAIVNAYLSSKWNLTTVMDSDGDGVADADDPDMVNPAVSIPLPSFSAQVASAIGEDSGIDAIAGNVRLWLDASHTASVVGDGTNVDEWLDLSGNGNHVKQTGTRPTLSNNFVQFTTDTDNLESDPMGNDSFLNISNDFTTFIVKRDYDRTAQGDSNASYLNYSKATFVTIDDLAFNLYREGGAYPNKNKFIVKSTGGAYTQDYVTITNIDPDTVSITGYRRSGIYTELYKNTNQPAASDSGTAGTIADSDPYVLQVGDANTYLKADIAEVIVFDKALSAAEYAIVNAYLAQKWGLTSAADSDSDGVADASDAFPMDDTKSFNAPDFSDAVDAEIGSASGLDRLKVTWRYGWMPQTLMDKIMQEQAMVMILALGLSGNGNR